MRSPRTSAVLALLSICPNPLAIVSALQNASDLADTAAVPTLAAQDWHSNNAAPIQTGAASAPIASTTLPLPLITPIFTTVIKGYTFVILPSQSTLPIPSKPASSKVTTSQSGQPTQSAAGNVTAYPSHDEAAKIAAITIPSISGGLLFGGAARYYYSAVPENLWKSMQALNQNYHWHKQYPQDFLADTMRRARLTKKQGTGTGGGGGGGETGRPLSQSEWELLSSAESALMRIEAASPGSVFTTQANADIRGVLGVEALTLNQPPFAPYPPGFDPTNPPSLPGSPSPPDSPTPPEHSTPSEPKTNKQSSKLPRPTSSDLPTSTLDLPSSTPAPPTSAHSPTAAPSETPIEKPSTTSSPPSEPTPSEAPPEPSPPPPPQQPSPPHHRPPTPPPPPHHPTPKSPCRGNGWRDCCVYHHGKPFKCY